MNTTCKKLIEVDLPIRAISEHARKDQNIRKGHLHTMHVWWATRPLASCRAVILATILPDPADPNCPKTFRTEAQTALKTFTGRNLTDPLALREQLLKFVADCAAWDAGVNPTYLSAARRLVAAAHPEGAPLVLDPFAGAGSIPFEALRLGAHSFAGDLNPVAVLINKVAEDYVPKYGSRLADAVRVWGKWVLDEAHQRLHSYYPEDDHNRVPFAHVWARTIRCEGPGCGAEVPLLGMLTLSRKGGNRVALRYTVDKKHRRVDVDLFNPKSDREIQPGIVKRFSATCPVCTYTTPYKQVREQIRSRHGGTKDARLVAVGFIDADGRRTWRVPNAHDLKLHEKACVDLAREKNGSVSWLPDEPFPTWYSGVFNPGLWGIDTWGKLFTDRQALALIAMCKLVRTVFTRLREEQKDEQFAAAVATCIALGVSKTAIYNTSNCYLHPDFGLKAAYLGTGMAMVPDFAEMNPLVPKYVGGLEFSLNNIVSFIERESVVQRAGGDVQQGSARRIPLPDDSVPYVVTDPPYYAAVPYSDLSDLCYVWLRRALLPAYGDLLKESLTPKDDELIAYYVQPTNRMKKDSRFFEEGMQQALNDARRVLQPGGVAVVIFAHKGTAGWEALLNALVNAAWTVTASWPIDTENRQRWRAAGSATLSSSVHLVCRPRENPDGSLKDNEVGDWREVLAELPKRIRDWMPRLSQEGIVGADAIFACLGPALEVFSRYSRVEKASGEQVSLRDYLEQVWAAVSQEALRMVFEGADASGFEEDARLTAMWLWTLSTVYTHNGQGAAEADDVEPDDDDEGSGKKKASGGYALEYDTARKIAQGLGAHLENLQSVVAVEGETARLRPVTERTRALFGKEEESGSAVGRRKKPKQMELAFEEIIEQAEAESAWGTKGAPKVGETTLDRVHQAMILFATGRSEAMRRFLVEEGVGRDGRFWTLAQALSALYPAGSDERRWVDGVLARKKGLGF